MNMVLTNFAVSQAKGTGKAYTLNDTDALSLAVSANGFKCWHFRYYWMGERKRMSLGTYPEVSLREARVLRDEARTLVARGINPRSHRKQKRATVKLAGENTFKLVFERWHAHRSLSFKKGRQTSLSQVERVFAKDVLPKLGHRSIFEIKRQDLLDVLGAIERRSACSVAKKVRPWFNQMFRYALVKVDGLDVNPASDLDVVAKPTPPVRHQPFLRLAELPECLRMLRTYPGRLGTQLGLRMLFLTGVRTGELRWASRVAAADRSTDFEIVFHTVLAAFDLMPGEFSVEWVQDELIGQMADYLDEKYDTLAFEFTIPERSAPTPAGQTSEELPVPQAVHPASPPQVLDPASVPQAVPFDSAIEAAHDEADHGDIADDADGLSDEVENADEAIAAQAEQHIVAPAPVSARLQSIQRLVTDHLGEEQPEFEAGDSIAIPVEVSGPGGDASEHCRMRR